MYEGGKYEIIGEGSYGCVTLNNPEKTVKPKQKKNVYKIQKKSIFTDNEILLGKKIRDNINNYFLFFVPILKSSNLTQSEIQEKNLTQCELIDKTNINELVSSEMNYGGKQTLEDYFTKQLTNVNNKYKIENFLMEFIDAQLYLLKSVEKMESIDVIHLDIKENNVVFHEVNKVFLLIDFGLGINAKQLDYVNYSKPSTSRPFGFSYPDYYIPWTLDILLLSEIASHIQPRISKDKYEESNEKKFNVSIPSLLLFKKKVTAFVKNNPLFKDSPLFSKQEVMKFEKDYYQYIDTWRGKTWGQVWKELYAHWKTWDCYGVNVTFLRILMDSDLISFINTETKKEKPKEKPLHKQIQDTIQIAISGNNQLETVNFFKQYLLWMKTCILSTPTQRPSTSECISKIESIFKKTSLYQVNQVVNFVKSSILTDTNLKKTSKNFKQTTLKNIEEENNRKKAIVS